LKPLNLPFFRAFSFLLRRRNSSASPARQRGRKSSSSVSATRHFIQLRAPSFQALTPRQQALAYWLTQASIAIDPIIYDQFSAYGLRQKRLLEEIMAHSQGNRPGGWPKNRRVCQTFLGQPRQPQRPDLAEISCPASLSSNWKSARLMSAQHNGAFQTPYADLAAAQDSQRSPARTRRLAGFVFRPTFEPMTPPRVLWAEKIRSRPARTLFIRA
jgi:hypothetical protein